MPRKSKKNNEPELPAVPAPATQDAAEPQAVSVSTPESDLPIKKAARKPRAKKSAAAETAAVEIVLPEPAAKTPEVEAEALANAADTFDDAFEANGATEAAAELRSQAEASSSEPAKPKKARKSKKAQVPAPEPEPQADGDSDDLGSAEADELEGDRESGSGHGPHDEDEEEAHEKHAAPLPPPKLERLQKILAAAGVASRRHAEELITEGRVQVNGKLVTTLGSKADAARDHIRVDGKLLHGAERLRYFVLNKPRGFVTTVSDPEGRATVMEFFAKMNERLYPIGRLDYLSEGLLLMTNDGELANKLTRASSGVEKTYLVKVSGQPDEELIEKLRQGINIERGRAGEGRVDTAPARIQEVRSGENPWFEVTLIEGRNRELRKMFEEIGHHVEKIRRVGYGPLVLDLEPGQMRELDEQELKLLRLAAEGKWKPKRIKAAAMLPKEAGRSVDHEGGKKRGQGWRPPNQDRRPGGRASAPPGRGASSFGDRGRSQDRGAAARGGEDRRQTAFRPQAGGQDRSQDRPQFGSRPAAPRREGAQGFGRQDRSGERPVPRSGPRDGQRGWQGAAQGGADRGGPRSGFSRPQGDRPFRPKPAFDAGRGGSEARPPRPGRPAVGAGDQRFGSRPPRPGQFGKPLDSRGFKARWDRPAAGAGEQRSASRPPRSTGSSETGGNRGFKPRSDRPVSGRPPEGRPARTFGDRPAQTRSPQSFTARPPRLHIEEDLGGSSPRNERPAPGRPAQSFTPRPPRPAAGGFRPDRGGSERRPPSGGQGRGPNRGPGSGPSRGPSRGPAGSQSRGPSRGRPSGGKPSFGSGPRGGRPASGAPRGNRPGSGPSRGPRGNNNRGR